MVAQLYMTIPLSSRLEREFDSSPETVAWAGSAFGFAYAGGFLIFGPLSDRIGRIKVIVPGLIATAVATVSVAVAPTIEVLIILRVVEGLVAASFVPPTFAYLATMVPRERHAASLGWFTAGLLFASVAGQLWSQVIDALNDWRWSFALPGVLYVAAAVIISTFPRDSPAPASHRAGSVFVRMVRLLGRVDLVAVYVSAFILLGSYVVLFTALAHGGHQVDTGSSELFAIRLAVAPAILLAPLAARPIMRWGGRRVALTGLCIALTGAVLVSLVQGPLFVGIAAFVFTGGIAAVTPALIGIVSTLAPEERGGAAALYTFSLMFGASVVPIVALSLTASFSLMMLGAAGTLVVAIVLVFVFTHTPPER